MMTKLATTSFPVVLNTEDNLKKYISYIEQAAAEGAKLIVLPEQSLQGYLPTLEEVSDETRSYQLANAELVPEGKSTQLLIQQAKQHDIYIVWGMTEQDADDANVLYNTAVLVGPEGFVGKYRKVHQPGCESQIYTHGTKFEVFDTAIGKIGLMICYDKAFPESARELYVQGAEIICVPAAWPMAGDPAAPDDSDPILDIFNMYDKTRAAENAVFFISCNQSGTAGTINYCGHSRITHPFGMEMACTGWGEGIVFAEADIQESITMAGGPAVRLDRHLEAYQNIGKM
ncbi:MAG: carbon-nitrogen hydrolase family protein [Oscillospiraceae bacterium]|nr:carbon-nitrogen hydrolase family protein [Oscillospiraceae bacterium]